MNKLIKLLTISTLLFGLTFTLGGCFGGGDGDESETAADTGFTTYATNNFKIDVPSEWEVINQNDFTKEVPGETLVVFRNNVKNETFTSNVNIVANKLQESVSTEEYAKLVHNRQKSGLIDYSEKSNNKTKIFIGEQEADTFVTTFEARKATNENPVKYVQTYGVKGNTAYIVTGAVSPSETESVVLNIEKIVKSFRLN